MPSYRGFDETTMGLLLSAHGKATGARNTFLVDTSYSPRWWFSFLDTEKEMGAISLASSRPIGLDSSIPLALPKAP